MKNLLQVLVSKVSSGVEWVKSLKEETEEVGLNKEEGMTLVSQYIASIYTHFTTEELKKIVKDVTIQDQVIKSIRTQLDYEDEDLSEWDEGPLEEIAEELDGWETEFINYFAPDFDWSANYTYKVHRQLFRTIKGKLSDDVLGIQTCDRLRTIIHSYYNDEIDYPSIRNNKELLMYISTKSFLKTTVN